MDAERFDGLVREFSSRISRRGALGMLAALGALGLGAPAAGRGKRGNRQRAEHWTGKPRRGRRDKVTICHRTGFRRYPYIAINVPAQAVPAHEAHGDLVDCPNLQVLDVEHCTCVCPAEEIECDPGQRLDPETCTCVSGLCVPSECERGNNACRHCSCSGDLCACAIIGCIGGPCDPVTGCPRCVPSECESQNNACLTCSCSGAFCACAARACENGVCDPVTGCPDPSEP